MKTIFNLFSNLDDLNKNKSITTSAMEYKKSKIDKSNLSYALSQGEKFKKYQDKIISNVEKNMKNMKSVKNVKNMSESFQGLTEQTKNVLQETDISSQKQNIENLRAQYDSTLQEYNTIVEEIQNKAKGYLERVNPSNPYLNKTVSFTSGHKAYVTNKGVVKFIPTMEIWSSSKLPTNYIRLNIPWDNSYNTPGTIIPTTPPLISGTSVQLNQSLGNEGSNVFVNKYLSDNDSAPTYQGCYADNTTTPLMTFIGNTPPPPTNFINGDFSQPQIANDTYQYITSSTQIPGWYFNAVLLNNSSAWGYPMPYPSGNQCVSIQNTQYIAQTVYLQSGITYTLSFFACGRNCCSGINPITIHLYKPSGEFIKEVYPNYNPLVNVWGSVSINFTVETSQNTAIHFVGGMEHGGDYSSALANIQLTTGSSSVASYSYDQCKQAAINGGYQYFALQNVNNTTSQGYCAVSNSQPTATSLGESMVVTGSTALWASNTTGQTGNTAILTTNGSLSVINSSGTSIFTTDNSTTQPGNYLGCYGDTADRAMQNTSNDQYLSFDECKNLGSGYKYFATQAARSSGLGWCAASNDISMATKYGKASNCTKNGDNWMGGAWSNAIYSTEEDGNYFLILQDDGNMVIYRGTGPNDNQEVIWASDTKDKSQQANPLYAASKGKYGKNWIASGSTLAAGDFVGSTDGSIALMMQSDGNLVLYTWSLGTNCQQMADGNMGAGPGGNALYGFSVQSIPGNMGKLAYVDENSELHSYPENNIQLVNDYTPFPGIDSSGYDIPGASYGNATLDQCKSTCNSNSECAGFAFSENACYPKYNTMFPNGASQVNSNVDIYIKNREPITPPTGVSKTTLNTDTVSYQNYIPGGEISRQYGLASATSVQKQQLSNLQSRMNMITNQINNLSNQFKNDGSKVDRQSTDNLKGSTKYLNELDMTKNQINSFSTNISDISGILNDSDIVVLQKNYDYLFWSILAAGTVLISMNIIKKTS